MSEKYVFQEYPKAVYNKDGVHRIAANPEDEAALDKEGFYTVEKLEELKGSVESEAAKAKGKSK